MQKAVNAVRYAYMPAYMCAVTQSSSISVLHCMSCSTLQQHPLQQRLQRCDAGAASLHVYRMMFSEGTGSCLMHCNVIVADRLAGLALLLTTPGVMVVAALHHNYLEGASDTNRVYFKTDLWHNLSFIL